MELVNLKQVIESKTRDEQQFAIELKRKEDVLQVYGSALLKLGGEKEIHIRNLKVAQHELNDKRREVRAAKSEKRKLLVQVGLLQADIDILSNNLSQEHNTNNFLSAEVNKLSEVNKKLQIQIDNAEKEEQENQRNYQQNALIYNEIDLMEENGQNRAMLTRAKPSTISSPTENEDTDFMPADNEFVCKCGKRYNKKRSYDKHMQRHKTQLICDLRQKIFKQIYDLKRHMLHHTGVKPFTCLICEKSFSQKSNLSQHLKIHSRKQN